MIAHPRSLIQTFIQLSEGSTLRHNCTGTRKEHYDYLFRQAKTLHPKLQNTPPYYFIPVADGIDV